MSALMEICQSTFFQVVAGEMLVRLIASVAVLMDWGECGVYQQVTPGTRLV